MPASTDRSRRAARRIAAALTALAAGCASGPRAPEVAPATPLSGLQRLASLPFYGETFDIDSQDDLARLWAKWWDGHYPGATWSVPSTVAAKLAGAGALEAWRAEQATYMATGQWSNGLVRAACSATDAQALVQITVFHAATGAAAPGLLGALNPFAGGGGPSAARVAVTVTSCADGTTLWRRARELAYSASYTQTKMVEYTLGYVSDSLNER